MLQYLAGLTILLDLFGEAKVEALYDRAGDARKKTVVRIKMLVPRSVSTSKDWFNKLLWLTVPLAYITTGFSFFWVQAYLLHYSLGLSVWLTVAGMVVAPAAAVIWLAVEGESGSGSGPLKAFGGVLLTAVALGSWIGGHEITWWQWILIQIGAYALLVVAFAVSLTVYSVCIGTAVLLLSIAQLILLAIFIVIARPARWALQKNAHPLRWLAFFIFSIGFFLDLLAS